MTSLAGPNADFPGNPLDLLEELVSANDWACDRTSDVELAIQLHGYWVDYHVWSVWNETLQAIYFACHFECRIPASKRTQVQELVTLFNEKLWLGHFDFSQDEATVFFRHTVPLRGTRGASVEQLEDLVDTAVTECERFYPALQLLVWGGQSSAQALAVAMMDTVGEA